MNDESSLTVASFLRDKTATYEQLDALLLLARVPTRAWSVADVSEKLELPMAAVEAALEELLAGGDLLQVETEHPRAYRYAPSEELGRLVDELQLTYSEQRMEIVRMMTNNAIERVRRAAAKRLAQRHGRS